MINNSKFLFAGLVAILGLAAVSAFIPLEKATTSHIDIGNDIDDQDQILVFSFHDLSVASEQFITPNIENGWVGKVNLYVCEPDGEDPDPVSIDVDLNNDGDTLDPNESGIVSIDIDSEGCADAEADLPSGVDQIAIDPATGPETILVTIVLDTNPEI